MNVLIVDDEDLIRKVIKEYAINENYKVYESSDGYDAINIVNNNDIDIIILDIMMPKINGYETCKKIKEIKNIPIIMLSARSEEYDKLMGFGLGIDDYITKPFSPKELIARIKAVLKRNNEEIDNYQYKELELNNKSHKVTINSKEIKLTPKEYELLLYFINNKNIALTREQLLTKVWGYDYYGDDRTIDTHIKMLRNNLGIYRNLIKTIRSVGYKFEEE